MVSVQPGHVTLHALDTQQRLLRHYKNPEAPDTAWSGLTLSPVEAHWGTWRYDPVVETRILNEYSAFLVDTQHHLRQSNFNLMTSNGMGVFKDLGGKVNGPPTVCRRNHVLHIFYIGFDHTIYHKQWDGARYTPNNDFEKVHGTMVCSMAAVSSGPDEVSIFAIGVKGAIVHHFQWTAQRGWSIMDDIPGEWTGPLTVVSDRTGNWDLFGPNMNGFANHISQRDGKISNLEPMPGHFQTIDAISWGPGRVDIFAWGVDRTLSHRQCNSDKWGGWVHLAGRISQRPTPVSHSRGALCVFCVTNSGVPCLRSRNVITGVWSNWIALKGVIAGRMA